MEVEAEEQLLTPGQATPPTPGPGSPLLGDRLDMLKRMLTDPENCPPTVELFEALGAEAAMLIHQHVRAASRGGAGGPLSDVTAGAGLRQSQQALQGLVQSLQAQLEEAKREVDSLLSALWRARGERDTAGARLEAQMSVVSRAIALVEQLATEGADGIAELASRLCRTPLCQLGLLLLALPPLTAGKLQRDITERLLAAMEGRLGDLERAAGSKGASASTALPARPSTAAGFHAPAAARRSGPPAERPRSALAKLQASGVPAGRQRSERKAKRKQAVEKPIETCLRAAGAPVLSMGPSPPPPPPAAAA